MKHIFLLAILLFCTLQQASLAQTGGTSINTTGADPDPSAILDVSSSTQGILIPRLTETERLSMPNLSEGLLVYQTDGVPGYYVYQGSVWTQFPTVGQSPGDVQYWDGEKWVMVPTGSPGQFLMLSETGSPVWAGLEPIGTGYGVLASVVLDSISGIYALGAAAYGRVLNSGGTPVSDYGVCFSTSPNPTINDSFNWYGSTNVGNTGFSGSLDNLQANTTYYARAYAINAAGVAYSNEVLFNTLSGQVQLITKPISQTGGTFLVTGGMITDYAGASITDFGVCWSTSPDPTLSNSFKSTPGNTENYPSHIIGLSPGTTYYFRAYATTNGLGTFYGDDVVGTTLATVPIAVGEAYDGGIIFYVDETGEHGMVVAQGDFGSSSWGCNNLSQGATGSAIGTGAANTATIVAGCAQAGIPARVCNDLVHEGYSDWFLPSRDELVKLFETMYLFLHWNAGGGSAWSSTEGSCGSGFGGACSAYYHYYESPSGGSFANKNSVIKIRPVRNF